MKRFSVVVFALACAGLMLAGARVGAAPLEVYAVDSFFDIFTDVSVDVYANGTAQMRSSDPIPQPDGSELYPAEIIEMELLGLSPVGAVMIRESPTRISAGRFLSTPVGGGGGGYYIDSFFDIFVEISMEGGEVLHNQEPARYSSDYPADSFFDLFVTLKEPVGLYDESGGTLRGEIRGSYMHLTPEPTSLVALLCGLGGLGAMWRKRG